MRLSRKLIVAAGVAVAAGSSAVAVAATQGGSKGSDPHPLAARGGPGWGGGPHGAAWAGGPRGKGADTRGVLDAIRKAVVDHVVTVAGPIVDQAVKDGKLTRAQADELKAVAAQAAKDGRPHLFEHRDLLRDADVREVARDISRALVKQAPGIGGPIIDQAVNDGKLTQEQGDRAKERLADMAQRAGG
jgi:polyhydroxyalkanoate synthesis regulator phasin